MSSEEMHKARLSRALQRAIEEGYTGSLDQRERTLIELSGVDALLLLPLLREKIQALPEGSERRGLDEIACRFADAKAGALLGVSISSKDGLSLVHLLINDLVEHETTHTAAGRLALTLARTFAKLENTS